MTESRGLSSLPCIDTTLSLKGSTIVCGFFRRHRRLGSSRLLLKAAVPQDSDDAEHDTNRRTDENEAFHGSQKYCAATEVMFEYPRLGLYPGM